MANRCCALGVFGLMAAACAASQHRFTSLVDASDCRIERIADVFRVSVSMCAARSALAAGTAISGAENVLRLVSR